MGKLSTHQRRARTFVQRADWDGALAEMRQALNADANNPATHNQMGDLFLRKEDIAQACDHFEKAIDLYAQLGLHNNAVALCRKVMRLAPARIEVRYSLARLRFDQGLRADGVAAFSDYLENAPTDSPESVQALEERCRGLVDAFPDAAPVGKILEKLERIQSFQCAFEIVQRLAQRAADAGDDASALRYTEKMRSLQVLVGGSGGGDILAESSAPPPRADASESVATAESPGDPVVEIDAEAAGSGVPEIEIEDTTLEDALSVADLQHDPPSLEMPAIEDREISAPASAATPEPPAATPEPDAPAAPSEAAPEVDATGAASLDDLLQDLDAAPAAPRQASAPERDETPSIDLDFGSPASSPDPPAAVESDAALPNASAKEDATGVPEYEISETSLEDVAAMFEDTVSEDAASPATFESVSPPRSADPPPPPSMQPPPKPAPSPQAAASPQAPHAVTPPQAPEAHPDARPPTAEPMPPPEVEPAGPEASGPGGLRAPVWIPDPSADPNATPEVDPGQVHELEDVIETFRDQMAKALGDDASARYDLGVAYYEMGLYNEALSEFEAAVKDPRYRDQCLEIMAACLGMQGRHAEIVEMLSPMIENDGSDVGLGLRYTMGVACEALGLREDARHHFEQIARIDSSYRDVQARLRLY